MKCLDRIHHFLVSIVDKQITNGWIHKLSETTNEKTAIVCKIYIQRHSKPLFSLTIKISEEMKIKTKQKQRALTLTKDNGGVLRDMVKRTSYNSHTHKKWLHWTITKRYRKVISMISELFDDYVCVCFRVRNRGPIQALTYQSLSQYGPTPHFITQI